MKATNEREYTTAVREIDVARKAVSALETEILKLMERIEKLEAQVAAAEPEMESRRVEIDGQLKKMDRGRRDEPAEARGAEGRARRESRPSARRPARHMSAFRGCAAGSRWPRLATIHAWPAG